MITTTTYDDTLYQLVPKRLPSVTEMRPVIARMCRTVESGALVSFDDFWEELLSAAPTAQPAERIPLTLEQIEECFQSAAGADEDTHIRFARIIEAEHGIKGES